MIIGVIADTHGLVRPEVMELFQGVDLIVHAGDIGSQKVLDSLQQVAPVRAVRGNVDRGAWAESLPDTDIIAVDGCYLYLLHDIGTLDLAPASAEMHVVISGHSHRAEISSRNGVFYLNPGSAGPLRFKLPVTATLLRIESGNDIRTELITLVPTKTCNATES